MRNEQFVSADLAAEMQRWRRHLHAYPETAFEEQRTAAFIAEHLSSFGLEVHTGLAGTGVVGTLRRGDAGRGSIGLRADMDALDMQEINTFEHRSRHEGKMHACGHDGHMAMLLGAAKHLAQSDSFSGTVHFIFQPAEENEGGGRAMVAEGLFERFPVNAVFGLHNFPFLPVGTFALRPGPMMAAYDVFAITVRGTGGHAAMPYLGQDAVLAAAQMVTMFQGIIGRNINPMAAAVISVTEFHGGSTWNVLPETVNLRGTARSFEEGPQGIIEQRLGEIARGVAGAAGLTVEYSYEKRYPALVNSPLQTEAALGAAARVSGRESVIDNLTPLMGSEDFAFFLQEKPGAFIGMGCGGGSMLHQAGYDFNDEALPVGAAYWVSLVEAELPRS